MKSVSTLDLGQCRFSQGTENACKSTAKRVVTFPHDDGSVDLLHYCNHHADRMVAEIVQEYGEDNQTEGMR